MGAIEDKRGPQEKSREQRASHHGWTATVPSGHMRTRLPYLGRRRGGGYTRPAHVAADHRRGSGGDGAREDQRVSVHVVRTVA